MSRHPTRRRVRATSSSSPTVDRTTGVSIETGTRGATGGGSWPHDTCGSMVCTGGRNRGLASRAGNDCGIVVSMRALLAAVVLVTLALAAPTGCEREPASDQMGKPGSGDGPAPVRGDSQAVGAAIAT